MFKVQELREIIKLVDSSSIDEFVYEVDGEKIKLKKHNNVVTEVVAPKVQTVVQQAQPQAQAQPQVQQPKEEPKAEEKPKVEAKAEESKPAAQKSSNLDDPTLVKITSPMVGTFYRAPSPDSPPYVQVGDKVEPDTVVCIVEAMKLFNEIEAEVKGEIVEILVENEQLVEFGQPLFLVKPAE
ncbi:acetyl-CoA carboxylase biotin carboxyl carrier protein [Ureibacillus sp. FSL K6-8385]|uniref:Biotin carboxyl carrier protein of acetyl-CoA carboxylase n=1 Tax=Ureibacillus terrenus TaxID=118246 RepID=A0A540V710_9BACL|nr:acetyl-CoA carboxylase biotin carboxyl carrier protein [Ureibacillus terrenus]MED3660762.1 acetyl-CoA carboxylase biotin carboxyl carrier protein [Ureibacillus terrenus]MED3762950.1 acetyl-CoA carboxylase biotin carboxyl carrier protein [Ureibacillus terrenus]TQE92511.1 acetyl-CoA carboxylase biotin carboxyl carrier protein [Ureibacillus terrenus]